MAQPSSDNSEENPGTNEAGTSKTEPSETETSESEPSEPEPYDAKPKKAKRKTAKGRRHRRRCHQDNFASFATYFRRVLKQVHTGLSLSHEAMNVMDSFVKHMFEQIAEEAGSLAHSSKHCTMFLTRLPYLFLLPGGQHTFLSCRIFFLFRHSYLTQIFSCILLNF